MAIAQAVMTVHVNGFGFVTTDHGSNDGFVNFFPQRFQYVCKSLGLYDDIFSFLFTLANLRTLQWVQDKS